MVSDRTRAARWILLGAVLVVSGCVANVANDATQLPARVREIPAGHAPVATDIIILLSHDAPAYTQVASKLSARLGKGVQRVALHGDEARGSQARAQLQASSRDAVIAIGMLAAETARGLRGKSVVFCQVFNFEQSDLVRPWMKGVSTTPPALESFRAWRKLDPRFRRIGLITGSGLEQVHADARTAARAIGAEIAIQTVGSDRETLFAFNRLAPKVDGFWLVPDNRILSSNVLRDVLSLAVKHGKPAIVFSEDMLHLGGLLSAEADPGDVADQVIRRLQAIGADHTVPGPAVIPLTRARITVNRMVARELGLIRPESKGGKDES